jgi:hypothetical protein
MSDPCPMPSFSLASWAREVLHTALLHLAPPGPIHPDGWSIDDYLGSTAGSALVLRLEALFDDARAGLETWHAGGAAQWEAGEAPEEATAAVAPAGAEDEAREPMDTPAPPADPLTAPGPTPAPADAPSAIEAGDTADTSVATARDGAPIVPEAAEGHELRDEAPDAPPQVAAPRWEGAPSPPALSGATVATPLRLPVHDAPAPRAERPASVPALRAAGPRPASGPITSLPAQSQRPTVGVVGPSSGSSALYTDRRPGQVPPAGSRQPPFAGPLSVIVDLPNGKVGTPYDSPVHARAASGEWLLVEEIDIPAGLGLSFDPTSRRLRGVPTRDGEHALTVHWRSPGPAGGMPRHPVSAVLVVNPDPRAMWKSLASDRTAPYFKPDEDHMLRDAPGGRRLVAASKRGRSHAHKGDFRDDDFELHVDSSTGWTLLAVADGAGSARVSRRGSQIAVATSVRTALRQLGGSPGENLLALVQQLSDPDARRRIGSVVYEILGHAAHDAVRDIEAEAQAHGYASRDFATTLLLAAWRPLPGAGHLFLSFWCGDGAIGLYQRGEGVHLLGDADSGEFAGQTRFLDRSIVGNPADLMRRLRVKVVPDFTALALMTDGVSDPKFETESNLAQAARWDVFWDELQPHLDAPEPDRALLDWLDFWSPGNHDDRTLALLW